MRRRLLLALLTLATAGWTHAQGTFPASPLKVLVGFPPGTAADLATRAVAEQMSKQLGQPVVVENRAGAGSNIAAKAVATANPDGYNLFAVTIANTINASFPNSTSVDPLKEFAPVTLIGNVPNVLVVHPSLNINSLQDLVQAAKTRNLSYGSSGIGTAPHLSGELFTIMTGAKLQHVPYKGSTPAVTDLLGGQVQLMFAPASSVMQHVRAGKLKALAVTSPRRTSAAPDLPTLDELGLKGFETSVWTGLVAPAGTPPAVLARLRTAAHAALDSAEVQAVYKAQGMDVLRTSPEEFTAHLRNESARWTKVIQAANIKPE
jgi:tripartite-type tricarboxylate transporter receptor subunit TctC